MSMTVDVSVNGQPIRRLLIENITGHSSGANTYRWTYADLAAEPLRGLLSAQQGRLQHVMEDGAMVLISKVSQAASETEVEI